MRLPQRVPWTSLSQLEQLCGYIYNDEDWGQAINRLSGWKFTGSLPFALEATLSLLVAIQADTEQSTPSLSRRNGYALAIVRFVNGLVDPLQSGPHARSIAAIATQIGIPLSFVELRHAATHEELPSLVALRQAAREVSRSSNGSDMHIIVNDTRSSSLGTHLAVKPLFSPYFISTFPPSRGQPDRTTVIGPPPQRIQKSRESFGEGLIVSSTACPTDCTEIEGSRVMDHKRQGKSLACVQWRSKIIRNSSTGVSLSCPGWAGGSSPNFQKVYLQSICIHQLLTRSRIESLQHLWKSRPGDSGSHFCSKCKHSIPLSRASLSASSSTS